MIFLNSILALKAFASSEIHPKAYLSLNLLKLYQ